MSFSLHRSPAEWFTAAERWYVEGHQGCVNCGDHHCVFRSETDALIELYCHSCDFSVCRQPATGRHFVWGAGQINRPRLILEQAMSEVDS